MIRRFLNHLECIAACWLETSKWRRFTCARCRWTFIAKKDCPTLPALPVSEFGEFIRDDPSCYVKICTKCAEQVQQICRENPMILEDLRNFLIDKSIRPSLEE